MLSLISTVLSQGSVIKTKHFLNNFTHTQVREICFFTQRLQKRGSPLLISETHDGRANSKTAAGVGMRVGVEI